ncbi:SprT family protein [Caldibacillus lycopersici]|uniref:Protein SprT-like n=1 Tax=Perspicuibacillus lycopersici TaxID=1325689 RepID=A0AAE3LRY0_9BACI|nr:SprT family protein [Perspicuibacillus lycopersici]MCU9615174.1 SprT family protein [Perspicuibacillus lycopersici]
MNNEQLQILVEKISLDFFNLPFLHQAIFNNRLRTTGGRYLLKSGNIEINKKYYEIHGESELIGIIKHELCHYHLHQRGRGYQHKDKDFKQLATEVGAPRFCTPLPSEHRPTKPITLHYYQCASCRLLYRRKRRVDTKRFVCGKCGGKLIKIARPR